MLLISICVGLALGLTFFGEISRLFGVDDVAWPTAIFRMIMVVLIVSLAVKGGWGHSWAADESLTQNLTTGFFVIIGLVAREPASHVEYDLGLSRLIDRIILSRHSKTHPRQSFVVNADMDSFVCLVAAFFGGRRGLDLADVLSRHPHTRKLSPATIDQLLIKQRRERLTPSQILGYLAATRPRSFAGLVGEMVYFCAVTGLADQNVLHRLFVVARGEGMTQTEFNAALARHGLQMAFNSKSTDHARSQSHAEPRYEVSTSERETNLATLGLKTGASAKEIKRAYRRMAVIYHPDRNLHKPAHQQRQAEDKMKAINQAFDWLEANPA